MMPSSEPIEAGIVARAGAALAEGATVAEEADVVEALRTVYDPEIPVNIYDLGLIYDLTRAADGDIHVVMTLTTPGCPVAGILPQQVADAAAAVDGVGAVVVELTWEPSWSPERMSEDARLALDMM
ncbi:MAG: iron-sulfur cluster assembly protein [Pseudomonadota bacterium]|nr:iron-sulfur cluster assembly protein [Pseudomonadota bacterium]